MLTLRDVCQHRPNLVISQVEQAVVDAFTRDQFSQTSGLREQQKDSWTLESLADVGNTPERRPRGMNLELGFNYSANIVQTLQHRPV